MLGADTRDLERARRTFIRRLALVVKSDVFVECEPFVKIDA